MGQTEAPHQQGTAEGRLSLIYGQYASSVRKRCYRLTGDSAAAEDLMQEVFARFLVRFEELPVRLNVHGYLLAMAHNIWMNQLRKDGHVLVTEIDESRTPDDRVENDPVRTLLLDEQRTDVQRGVAGLTIRQRRALALRELEGRTYGEIGAEMGLGANAVAQVVWRARTQLRRSLRRSQIDADRLADDCRARLDAMSDLVEKTSSDDTAALEAHMAECSDCRRALAAYQEAGWRLRGLVPFAPVVAIVARVGSALRPGFEGPAGIGAAAAVTAAVVVAAGGGGALVAHSAAPTGPIARSSPALVRNASHVVPGSPASRAARRAAHDPVSAPSSPQVRTAAVSIPVSATAVDATPGPSTGVPGLTPTSAPPAVASPHPVPPEKTKQATKGKQPTKANRAAPPGQLRSAAARTASPGQGGSHGRPKRTPSQATIGKRATNAGDHPVRTPHAAKPHTTGKTSSTSPGATSPGGTPAPLKPHGHAAGDPPTSPFGAAPGPPVPQPTTAGPTRPPGAAVAATDATAKPANPHSQKSADTPLQAPPPASAAAGTSAPGAPPAAS